MSAEGNSTTQTVQLAYEHEKCALCGVSKEGPSEFMFCGRCRIVVYCSKNHQVAHYKTHKIICRNNTWSPGQISSLAALACPVKQCACKQWQSLPPVSSNSNPAVGALPRGKGPNGMSEISVNVSTLNLDFEKLLNSTTTDVQGTSSVLNETMNAKNVDETQSANKYSTLGPLSVTDVASNGDPMCSSTQDNTWETCSDGIPFQHKNISCPLTGRTPQQTKSWILEVCQLIITDLDRYGVCVVDNLLGEARGDSLLREVQSLYSSGAFKDGQLVRERHSSSHLIRGDKITWVDGSEPYCRNIAVLIKLLDNIVMGANSLPNNGKLGEYRIKQRSKAMIACYPGNGTHYVKHVDNPNDDGRCVTAIYYLNKDWNTKESGGLLRIFPEGWSHQVADIEPLFDRVIFFWSDRRNPHEVQPAYRTRYAITLWYFDLNTRKRKDETGADSMTTTTPIVTNKATTPS